MEPEDIEAFNARVRRRNARIAAEQHASPDGPVVRKRKPGGIGRFISKTLGFGVVGGLFLTVGYIVQSELESQGNLVTSSISPILPSEQAPASGAGQGDVSVTEELADAGGGAVEIASTIGRTLQMLQSPYETFTPEVPRSETPSTDTAGRITTRQGPAFGSEVVLSAMEEVLPLQKILSSVPPLSPRFATEIASIKPNETCGFRAPLEAETVMGVRVARGRGPNVAYSFSDKEREDRLLAMVRVGLSDGHQSKAFKHAQRVIRAVDVYVTDRSGPLYLALQSSGNIAWRLHIAEGVTVAHIALVGNKTAALLAPPKDVTFEAVLAHDFLKGFRVKKQETGSADPPHCTVRPDRKPAPTWAAYEGANRGVTVDRNLVTAYQVSHAAYATWYKGAFGQDADKNTLTAFAADHVLIGPPPAPETKFNPARDGVLAITSAENLIIGAPDALNAEMYALHQGLIASAAGGDLANLNPPPMSREGQ